MAKVGSQAERQGPWASCYFCHWALLWGPTGALLGVLHDQGLGHFAGRTASRPWQGAMA